MEPAQALADLTEISSQIECAVLATESGEVVSSTLSDPARAERLARAAAELVEAAGRTGRDGLVQLEAATGEASVFVVRDAGHLVVAVTGPSPTVGLVFYDLKTCLRLAREEPAAPSAPAKPKRARKKKPEASDETS